ncbi:MAG: 4-phosphoerythronate dehydrogenase [Mariprofundaceae bacterium]
MTKHLEIVVDAHVWGVESAFSELSGYDVNLRVLENKNITNDALKDVDILLTRSATKVNADLLMGTPVRFAATATIGDDHYDKVWLDEQQIIWATAAGSSTGSVIEYMLASFLELHDRRLVSIPNTKLGIVGVGRIGGALAKVCASMGMDVLRNDPPRQRVEGDDGFSTLNDVLRTADVITLHTPLIREGKDKTFHLIDVSFLRQYQGKGIINAARGGCADNEALADWLDEDVSRWVVLDCWENEPNVSERLLKHPQTVIATPHIAGHSLDGKAANTLYIYRALCEFLDCEKTWDYAKELPVVEQTVEVCSQRDLWADLHGVVQQLYPLKRDHDHFAGYNAEGDASLADCFVYQRRHYPVRRAWALSQVYFEDSDEPTKQMARGLGIKVVEVADDG